MLFRLCLLLVLFLQALPALALVSEGRPGILYYNHPLFLDKKQIDNGTITQVRLAYGDTRDDIPDCLNTIDVFLGLELFAPAPEKSWVLVDYELQSILINNGFFGDADVFNIRACGTLEHCVELREQLESDPLELAKRATRPRPPNLKKARFDEIDAELEIGRKLIKAARCRGCHQIEGFGAKHAPSLTWKRFKYVPGWLESYLENPYRLRPAMGDLMMLQYSSPNARPNLQPIEARAVAAFLERIAKAKTPDDRFRMEAWQDYNCYGCHSSNYRKYPLHYEPTSVPEALRAKLKSNATLQICLDCHAFGDYSQKNPTGIDNPNRFAPDLLLAFEKLDLNYLLNYVPRPGFMQPGSRMPNLSLNKQQLAELKELVVELRRQIEAGRVKPVYNYYRMKKISD